MSSLVNSFWAGLPAPVPSGLISYYRGDDDATDELGVNDGTEVDSPTYETGVVGNAFDLVENSSIDLGSNAIVGGRSAFSVSFYAKVDSVGNRCVFYASWLTNTSILIQHYLNRWEFYLYTTSQVGGSILTDAVSGFSDLTWAHIVMTYDGSTMKCYLDGTVSATTYSQTGSVRSGTENERLGRFSAIGSFEKGMDGVGVWNKALSQSEVDDIYLIQSSAYDLV